MTDKSSVLERLSRRDAQRIEKLQKAHKAKEEVDACNESDDYFAAIFKTKSQNVEDLLTQVPTLDISVINSHFDIAKKEINELQKYVVTSALFLKEFNMRKYLGIVQNLQTNCYELEDKYVPRKKFGFTKKKLPKIDNTKLSMVDDYHGTSTVDNDKWNDNLFGFSSKTGQVLCLNSEELFQRDVSLRNLKNCTIGLKGVMGTLHMSNLENCIILCGPVTTSVFVEKCSDCKLVVACQQLRMHTSVRLDVYLHVTSKGIVEDCAEVKTAPYNLDYDDLDKHFSMSSLNKATNNWDKLDDFNWLAPDVPSPNWSILDASCRIDNWRDWWNKIPS